MPYVLPALALLLLTGPLLAAELTLHGGRLPVAWVGQDYAPGPLVVESAGRCPLGVVALGIVGGELPPGLSLNGAGYVRGVPTVPGTYTFDLEMRTACSRAVERALVTVASAPKLTLSAKVLEFATEAGGPLPAPQSLSVGGGYPGMHYALAIQGAAWLSARPGRGIPDDMVEVSADPGKLAVGEYRGKILVYTPGLQEASEVAVRLTVEPAGVRWKETLETPKVFEYSPQMPLLISPPPYLTPPVVTPAVPRVRARRPVRVKAAPPTYPRSQVHPLPKVHIPPAK